MFYFSYKLLIIDSFVIIVNFYVTKHSNVNVINFMHEKIDILTFKTHVRDGITS